MNPPRSSKMIGSGSHMICLIGLLCLMPGWPAATHAKPLARPQRQALTGELATGLTGAGMRAVPKMIESSFNPLYEGQSVIDSYYGYQPDGQRRAGQYDISPQLFDGNTNNNWAPRGGAYGGYKGGAYGTGSGGLGYEYGGQNLAGVTPAYGNINNNNDWRGWQGFGAGRNPQYNGNPASQYGLKY